MVNDFSMLNFIPKLITEDENDYITGWLSKEEIKGAIFFVSMVTVPLVPMSSQGLSINNARK